MYRLTERRYEKALPIFEAHRKRLESGQHVDAQELRRQLRECWDTGTKEVGNAMTQLLDDPRFGLVAASYLRYRDGSGVAHELKPRLAALYGLKTFDSPERDEKEQSFWAEAFASLHTHAGDRRA